MSNYYAKAINPRTNKEETCTVLDTPTGRFLHFKEDECTYNLNFFKGNVIPDEQEAINKDGEEIIEQWDSIYNLNPDAYDKTMKTREAFEDEGYPNFFDYSFNWKWRFIFWLITLGFLTVMTSGIYFCVQKIAEWIGIIQV